MWVFFFFQAEDGIRDGTVTGVQTCALPICPGPPAPAAAAPGPRSTPTARCAPQPGAGPGRSARPRTSPGRPRYRPPPGLPVAELGREKSARRAQDRIHPAQLSVLPLQRPDPRRIRRRSPRPQAPVDLRLLSPAAQRVRRTWLDVARYRRSLAPRLAPLLANADGEMTTGQLTEHPDRSGSPPGGMPTTASVKATAADAAIPAAS